ncbi:Octicosapeptide/Phox/Bem1p protein [Thalictrum thalictroides]|uniref:Octicosapeptide/Phox/Bem1p protein n=1 Tax=Thalictrum thalictroides TaxID=46969 RepID=A0A7J6XBT5_THATH|nr:Octicosapeptide/Phox/Bem1p protein [Thalictrum thalictroides]
MGKPSANKKSLGDRSNNSSSKSMSPKSFDEDTAMFITMAQELKDEGNKLFQKRDHEGAMFKYEKAIKLLPRNHIDVAYLRSNMAACYMQMGLGEYPMAINECSRALEVYPKYSKALLKRAKCYEALNRLDLAFKDVDLVLNTEPNNLTALEIAERVKSALEKKGIKVDDSGFTLNPEFTEIACVTPPTKLARQKTRKKKANKFVEKIVEDKVVVEENKDKVVVEENLNMVRENPDEVKEEEATRSVKLVLGEDIRCAQLPLHCSIQKLIETVKNRHPSLKAFLIKYKDQEGDLITITSTEELRFAEASGEAHGSLKLYIAVANPVHDSLCEGVENEGKAQKLELNENNLLENGIAKDCKKTEKGSFCIDDWIIQFARVFKNHVGFNSDAYLDLHDLGMKLYSDAMEDTVTCEEAQDLFDIAAEKFQEMAALALFNWGNVHMSKARKRVFFAEDASRETLLDKVKTEYDWAQKEFMKAGMRYDEALKIKPDFYEAFLASGQQQFEQARLSWYYSIASQFDLNTFPSMEILQLFDNAEDNMEKGMKMWEEMEEHRLNGLSTPDKLNSQLQKMGLDGVSKDITAGEAAEQAANMRSQVNLLWGTILYERSVVEFKLGPLPDWEECLDLALQKFELAGASTTDIAVIEKNHCHNQTAVEGLGFKIDEIVQAWNEMYDAKRWKRGVPSFRLEPLFRRRVPYLHHVLERI